MHRTKNHPEAVTVESVTIIEDSSLEQALKIIRYKNLRRLIVVNEGESGGRAG